MGFEEVSYAIHFLYEANTPRDTIKRAINNVFNLSFPDSISTIANVLINEKDYILALEYCNFALKSIKSGELYYSKAICHYSLGEYRACMNSLDKITNIVSEDNINHLKSECIIFNGKRD